MTPNCHCCSEKIVVLGNVSLAFLFLCIQDCTSFWFLFTFFFKILHSTHACRCWNCFIITMHHPWFMFYILICPLSSIIPSRPVSSRGPSFKESVLLSIHLLFSRFCVVSVASSVTYVTCVSSSLHSPAMSLFFHYHIPEKSPAAPLPRVYPYATVKYFVIIRLLPFL